MKRLICWFLGHHWLLVIEQSKEPEYGYYECRRCKERENYFF